MGAGKGKTKRALFPGRAVEDYYGGMSAEEIVKHKVSRYGLRVARQAQRVADLGNWPDYIDVQESLTGRVPTVYTPASGFDAGIACALGLIPYDRQKLAATLHAAYTPEAVEQVRLEAKSLEPDSETCWWLAACSVCTEGKVAPEEFIQQVMDFYELTSSPEQRVAAAKAELTAMSQRFQVRDGVAFGTEDGAMQGAYIAGHDLSAMYDESSELYFIGTFRETLGLEEFPWSDDQDELGRAKSGPVHGSRQYVKAANRGEYLGALSAIQKSGLFNLAPTEAQSSEPSVASAVLSAAPPEALEAVEEMLAQLSGPLSLGTSKVVDGWWLETHTIGCRHHAEEPEAEWWDRHFAIYDEYASDGISVVIGEPADGYFG